MIKQLGLQKNWQQTYQQSSRKEHQPTARTLCRFLKRYFNTSMDRIYWYLDEVDIFDTLMVLQNPYYLLDKAKMEMILHKIIKWFSDDQSPKLAVYMREEEKAINRQNKPTKYRAQCFVRTCTPCWNVWWLVYWGDKRRIGNAIIACTNKFVYHGPTNTSNFMTSYKTRGWPSL